MSDVVRDDALPFDALGVLAVAEAEEAPGLVHVEAYSVEGLLTLLWHGDRAAEGVVICGGGAMGGTLGPGHGVYAALGQRLGPMGIGVMRIGYRRPNDIDACTLDMCAAADLAWRAGARIAVTAGHSFGGAIAIRAAVAVPMVAGVVTYATQSAGCEPADKLGDKPLLMFHGDEDELLPAFCSETVQRIAGHGDLVRLPGEGHMMLGAHEVLLDRSLAFVLETLARPGEATSS